MKFCILCVVAMGHGVKSACIGVGNLQSCVSFGTIALVLSEV
jgi:hypothetical protein